MADTSDGARLKVWSNKVAGSDPTDPGGWLGRIKKVTYVNSSFPNRSSGNVMLRLAIPSGVAMEDFLFKDFTGTTSRRCGLRVGQLLHSAPEVR
ncbi:hypothetical protein MCOR25_009280 [Pyricularia grisea]|nr:hypothetical protein MCOR25_009280 [Pyricularia grisea]